MDCLKRVCDTLLERMAMAMFLLLICVTLFQVGLLLSLDRLGKESARSSPQSLEVPQ